MAEILRKRPLKSGSTSCWRRDRITPRGKVFPIGHLVRLRPRSATGRAAIEATVAALGTGQGCGGAGVAAAAVELAKG